LEVAGFGEEFQLIKSTASAFHPGQSLPFLLFQPLTISSHLSSSHIEPVGTHHAIYMKKSKKYTGLLDEWIESQIEQSAQDPNVGFVETLYQTCSSTFLHLWRSRLRFMPHGPRRNTLKKDVAKVPLWEENFAPGHLDIILGQSSRLKTNVVENLKGIGEILIGHFVGSDDTMSNLQIESGSIQNLVKELRAQLDNAEIFLSTEEKSNPSSDENTSDDSSSTTDGEMNRYGRLHSYVLCLMDLVPAIERHALCLQQRVTELHDLSGNKFALSQSALPFAIRIRDRFVSTSRNSAPILIFTKDLPLRQSLL
jgi:hypothetical protein